MQRSTKSKTKPNPSKSWITFRFEAIGTVWLIEIYGSVNTQKQSSVRKAINERIETFDQAYSRFRPDSFVSKMSQKAGTYNLPDDAQPMLDLYRTLYEHTAGSVTPLIGQTLSDAGYDADYSLQPKKLSSPPTWDDALDYSFPTLILKIPVLLDLGALGKGYLVDLLADLLEDHGITQFCINAGGDIIQRGKTPTQIGLEHPDDDSQAIGVVTLKNHSLCGSSGNRRAWDNYNHLIDPHSLTSPKSIKAIWVTAESTMLADGLATALFFVVPQSLQEHYTFEYAIVYEDLSLQHSTKFPAEFF